MLKIDPEILPTVKRDFDIKDIFARVKIDDPVTYAYWVHIKERVGAVGLSHVVMMYRIIETQLEINALNEDAP